MHQHSKFPSQSRRSVGVRLLAGITLVFSAASAVLAAPALWATESPGSKASSDPTLRTDDFVAKFCPQSTALQSLRLLGKRFRDPEGKPIELVSTDKRRYLPMGFKLDGVELPEGANWSVEPIFATTGKGNAANTTGSATAPTGLRFRWSTPTVQIERKLEAGQGAYQIWSTLTVTNRGQKPLTVRPTFHTFHYVARRAEEGGMLAGRSPSVSFGVCQLADKTEREDREELQQGLRRGGAPRFVGLENSYFAGAIAADKPRASGCELRSSDRGGSVKEPHGSLFHATLSYAATSIPSGQSSLFRTLQYFGPKDLDALRAAGHDLPKVIDFGFFSVIAKGLTRLLAVIEDYVGNWGLAIILLTLLVKLVLYPLTEKSFQSMARMRLLKPELDRVQELYKHDREKKGAAVMELYRKNKINPLGGCLPSLLQLPVWFSLYASLSSNVELYHAPFGLWWQDLSAPDQFFVLPLILGVLMFFQQKMTPTSMDPAQAKIMLYMMPVMITGFMLFLPAGLCLYMVTNSVLGMAQQKFINVRLDRRAAGTSSTNTAATSEALAKVGPRPIDAVADKTLTPQPVGGRRHRRGRA